MPIHLPRKLSWDDISGENSFFTAFEGRVGSGKTYACAFKGLMDLRQNVPVFCAPGVYLNTKHLPDLADVPIYDKPSLYRKDDPAQKQGAAIVYFEEPLDVLSESFRCGTILWDELGAQVNNRESVYWPFELTLKLISSRKSHLNIYVSVQDEEMADKNMRRFYNDIVRCQQVRWPLLGLIKKSQVRPTMLCPWKYCTKNHGQMSMGDRPGKWPFYATFYRLHHIDPLYAGNKEKHNSKGDMTIPFDNDVAQAYLSSASVMREAKLAHEHAVARANKKK